MIGGILMPAKTYVIGNFKGGVGKSTAAQMLGFRAAQRGRKTLIIDLDMQGNTSDVLSLTHMNFTEEEGGGNDEGIDYDKTVANVLMNDEPLENAIYTVINNLDIMPANMSLEMYDDWVKEQYNDSVGQFQFMKNKFAPLLEMYDIIYLDVPPSISVYSKSAMYIADWAIVILQTQVKSMRNAMQYLEYMEFFIEEFNTELKVAGIIPFMLEAGDAVDKQMYEEAQAMYGDHLLENIVLKNARLKRYDGSGITMEKTKAGKLKQWDRKSHDLFDNILDELDFHETWYE